MITTFEIAGRFSAATSAGLMFYSLSRAEAERRLIESGFPPSLLDSTVDGLTWRSVLTSAVALEIETLTEEIEGLAGASDEAVASLNQRLDKVHRNQRRLMRQLASHSDAIDVERQSRQDREIEAEIDRRMRQYNSVALPADRLPRWCFERQVRG